MDLIKFLIDFVLHIDKHLVEIVTNYQTWTYLILFLIIFCETGLVVTPFLPGDSLLFASGAICAMEGNPLNIAVLIPLLLAASIIGDNTNYFIGNFLGNKVYEKNYKLIKRKYIDDTHAFYEKHGGKTLIFARFMPIIRTFAPFVAGIGKMKYPKFITFCVAGNVIWIVLFSLAGYFFGNIPIVQKNFTIVIMSIIVISILPPIIAVIKSKFKKSA
ncbi:MAG: DedA family protein [Bacteroidota bacterium]